MTNIKELYKTGQGAYIHGGNRSGKTTLSLLLLKHVLHNSECTAMFAPMADLVILNTKVMSGYHDEKADLAIRVIKNVDFLVIDDIGKEFDDGKDKARATLNSILRYRDMWNKPTIYTANSAIEDLRAHYGNSNFSIMSGRSIIISTEYQRDYRKEKKRI
jgi:DNA replication protein DnaC